jgi:hypothetical protein
MWRYLAGGGATLLLIVASFFLWQGIAQRDDSPVPEAPEQAEAADDDGEEEGAAPGRPPAADARNREQRRFDRADRDNDGRITIEEIYQPRRRAFQRLDTNGDGRLSFEEWAVRTRTRFAQADRDRNASLSREEYATTAPRRRPQRRAANCRCENSSPAFAGEGDRPKCGGGASSAAACPSTMLRMVPLPEKSRRGIEPSHAARSARALAV